MISFFPGTNPEMQQQISHQELIQECSSRIVHSYNEGGDGIQAGAGAGIKSASSYSITNTDLL
jgi:hypothetical protein